MKSENGKIIKIHPITELYPLMSDEEIEVLGEDIQTNGLKNKIVRDVDGTLIDGRNREEAAKRKGIKLKQEDYVILNGEDPIAFIFSQNNKRRHVLKSQRAMIAVKARDLEHKSKKSESDFLSLAALSQLSGMSSNLLAEASLVFKYAPEHVDNVINGSVTMEKALAEAKDRKATAQSIEAQMTRLRREATDLADLVTEERMALSEAFGALRERKESERRDRQQVTQFLAQIVLILDPRVNDPREFARSYVERFDSKQSDEVITKERLSNCLTVLKEITKYWKDNSDEISTAN